jgi:vacuolar-type H+-ATPase subunit I/STV1
MSIKSYLDELENLQAEIKRNNTRNKILRQRIKELEANIRDYLEQKGQHGLKYNGNAIIVEQRERRPAKKKKDREADVLSLLESLGIEDPSYVYNKLQEIQKGEPIAEQKIKFKKINNV